jgi:hypothetical protein
MMTSSTGSAQQWRWYASRPSWWVGAVVCICVVLSGYGKRHRERGKIEERERGERKIARRENLRNKRHNSHTQTDI